MELNKTSGGFRKFFLLKLTEQLILNSVDEATQFSINLKKQKRKNLRQEQDFAKIDEQTKKFIDDDKINSSIQIKKFPKLTRERVFLARTLPEKKSPERTLFRNTELDIPQQKPAQIQPTQINVPQQKPAQISKTVPISLNIDNRRGISGNQKIPESSFETHPSYFQRANVMSVRELEGPELDTRFSYLKPSPTREVIDLHKLNQFINDITVDTIECHGSDKEIIVRGIRGERKTGIYLSKEEIESVIEEFSMATRIPLHEGAFKVYYGKLAFSAIVSQISDSKFIIKKIKGKQFLPNARPDFRR